MFLLSTAANAETIMGTETENSGTCSPFWPYGVKMKIELYENLQTNGSSLPS